LGKILTIDIDLLKEIGIQLFNTFILIFVLSKFLYNPVVKFMKKREEKIKTELANANEISQKVNELKKEYDLKMQNAKKESATILDDARRRALENENFIIEDARNEADLLKKKTQSDIEKFKEQVKDEIRHETILVATEMAKKIVKVSISDKQKEKILDETIKEMENLKWLA